MRLLFMRGGLFAGAGAAALALLFAALAVEAVHVGVERAFAADRQSVARAAQEHGEEHDALVLNALAASKKNNLNVAYAVFVTDIGSSGWKDALAVLAHGLRRAADRSRHRVTLVVLSPSRLSEAHTGFLKDVGFDHVLRRNVPVPPETIQSAAVQEAQRVTQGTAKGLRFKLEEEQIKYWGLAMTNFDRVLVLDADTMVLDPMDELMETDADLVGTYDYGLTGKDQALPVVQGGFLLFKPNLTDFEAIRTLTRQGDFHDDGGGWKGTRIGFAYGGTGPDGLLAFYYNKDALPWINTLGQDQLPEGVNSHRLPGQRFLAVERHIYDVVFNDKLMKDVGGKGAAKVLADWVSGVKSVHFTGGCIKPWTCACPENDACGRLMDKWWELRADVARMRGLNATRSCKPDYIPMGF